MPNGLKMGFGLLLLVLATLVARQVSCQTIRNAGQASGLAEEGGGQLEGQPDVLVGELTQSLDSKRPDPDCVRGEPEPLFKDTDSGVVWSRFHPLSRSVSMEAVLLKNGDSLLVENSGCEYYVNTIAFVTKTRVHDCRSLQQFLKKQFTTILLGRINSALVNAEAIAALDQKFAGACDASLEKDIEFTYGNPDMPSRFWMDSLGTSALKKNFWDRSGISTVRFELQIGPL